MSGSQLPNVVAAVVPDAKVRDYLLNDQHIGNGGKAVFFRQPGYDPSSWPLLQAALLEHPTRNFVVRLTTGIYGTTYEVRCELRSPNGRSNCVRSFWIVDGRSPNPKFVTAYAAAARLPNSTP
jgi:filamentous hemagglutinin